MDNKFRTNPTTGKVDEVKLMDDPTWRAQVKKRRKAAKQAKQSRKKNR